MNLTRYSSLVLILGVLAGIFFPQLQFFKPYLLYMLGALIYLSSLDLTFKCLRQAIQKPRIQLTLLAITYLIIPVVTWFFGSLLIDDPKLLAGYVLINASPTAVAISVWTKIAKGDHTLGMSFSIVSLLLAPIMIPFWAFVLLSQYVTINLFLVAKILALVIFVPLLLAVLSRKVGPLKKIASPTILILIFLIFSSIVAVNSQSLFTPLAPKLLLLALLSVGVGFAASHILAKPFPRQEKIPLELAGTVKNVAIALSIALLYFGETATLPGTFLIIVHALLLSALFLHFDRHK